MLTQYQKTGDEAIVPLFRNLSIPNKAKSDAEGRPIYDDIEVVEIRFAGSRNYGVYPANEMSHWISDPYTGEQRPITYAERFRRQYAQFLEHKTQTKSGTPLDVVPFLTEARRSELKAQNIYTAEALAAVDGAELKNLGPGGREMKNQAVEYISNSKANIPNITMQAEMEAMRAKLAVLEEDNALLKHKTASGEARFEAMSLEQLREYITVNSGQPPVGLLNKRNLIRLAMEVTTPKDAA
jgi:hypothetical protein